MAELPPPPYLLSIWRRHSSIRMRALISQATYVRTTMTLMMVVVLVLVQSRRTRGGWGGADPTRSLQEQMLDLLLQKALE